MTQVKSKYRNWQCINGNYKLIDQAKGAKIGCFSSQYQAESNQSLLETGGKIAYTPVTCMCDPW